ncbi:nicotinate-nucleotide adenylyltransferase [Candidatus Sulfidibacterium hydrothermale]|uniref:nicotinate (nicotinamide) nucleotide adenylyltransferase n=1 Tax=Candidatus Sulfidibacterium hydrothermale TaxID=2875962 RepID=UPI001F0A6E72|nr:nicotinate (nicotinamide) nucleotide adenylyltransferase [Candidatus Sulfidibacterium hydrothermale]UBM61434.1 nicotinate-nucleotide adenylyltransferase [Candidatus Sulfidibacterium hydrothermale]
MVKKPGLSEKGKKVGLLFGSFNPIHSGHLILANYMAEFTDLDEVWFVVSPQNPLKEKSSLLPEIHRLALVRLAVEDQLRLKVTDIEFKMPKPSYTIDTLTWLSDKYPQNTFAMICGTDIFTHFHKWKNYREILKNYWIYVYPRTGSKIGKYSGYPHVVLFDAPVMEISASFIRKGIREKKNMAFWMPEKVYQYILEMHFYEK